jgi:hypothetical protein
MSLLGAVAPFLRVRKRKAAEPTDVIFGPVQRELFNAVLSELGLKKDRDGHARTAYSLRHTYICLRLMVEPLKFGEPCDMAIPSQALEGAFQGRCRD